MKLTIFNGSPRGEGSNTKILLEHFTKGFTETEGNSYELAYLVRIKEGEQFVRLFQEAEHILLATPLYADAMPGIGKAFIESLEPLCGQKGNADIGFIVQSGFPEPIHSRYLERYLVKLSARLGCRYIGTVIRGSVEGIRAMPEFINKKLFRMFYELGKTYGETGKFDEQLVRQLAGPEKWSRFRFRINSALTNKIYWNPMLKKNQAFEKRFDRPYEVE
jgi:NAD(P)H-dependent FMN reductase